MGMAGICAEMKDCRSCRMREGCIQVVPPTGSGSTLLICGEAPGEEEDERAEPFCGDCGQLLRQYLRQTGVIKRSNTTITNVLNCRPPHNKFPKDNCAEVCYALWLSRIIRELQPKLMLLLGNTPLEYVAGLHGITASRGRWIVARGIRTMPTYHPSYVMRCLSGGNIKEVKQFELDISAVAKEVSLLEQS
jgi:uracil-DNA glycosylase family 4